MRNESNLKIVCSGCGNPVDFDKADGELRKGHCSAIEYNSAFEIEVRLAIRPCRVCVENARRPMLLMREALAAIEAPNEKGQR